LVPRQSSSKRDVLYPQGVATGGHEDHWEAGADANDVLDVAARYRGEPGLRISM
jgi:hypothetical protein